MLLFDHNSGSHEPIAEVADINEADTFVRARHPELMEGGEIWWDRHLIGGADEHWQCYLKLLDNASDEIMPDYTLVA